MNKYQIVYNLHSKKHYLDIQCDTYQNARDFFQDTMVGELVEIRKYVYENKVDTVDDGNYYKKLKISLTLGLNRFISISIPKIKTSYKIDTNAIKNTFRLGNQIPDIKEISILK